MAAARKLIAENRKARHDYHILERLEAGIALTGTEVKSLRDGGGNLREAYAQLHDGEVFLVGANIAPYRQGNLQNHEPTRDRKLLLHRHEIEQLGRKVAERGMTLVPLQLYLVDGKVRSEEHTSELQSQFHLVCRRLPCDLRRRPYLPTRRSSDLTARCSWSAPTSRRTGRATCRTTSPPATASCSCTGTRSSSSGARWRSGG